MPDGGTYLPNNEMSNTERLATARCISVASRCNASRRFSNVGSDFRSALKGGAAKCLARKPNLARRRRLLLSSGLVIAVKRKGILIRKPGGAQRWL